jgi:Ser/Thr protein kinase RdoA (MazF antagonist)
MQALNKNFIMFALPLITIFSFSLLGLQVGKETLGNQSLQEKEVFDLEPSDVLVVKSLVDPSTIHKIVKKNYAFEEPINTSLLNVGINDMYLVETGNKKYVLRLSRADKYLTMTDSEFQFELEWLVFLNQQQVAVSYPIRRLDNQLYGLIQAPEGPRYVTLFSYAEGTTDMNIEQAYILGKSLAQLHIISDNFKTLLSREHLDIDRLVNHSAQRVKSFLKEIDEEKCALLEEIAKELNKQISALNIDELNYGIIAGDIHGGNQHFTSDNHLMMFDFEFCAYGYRIYDLATFRWSRGSNSEELWDSFLEGYKSVRKLSDSEIQAIDIFVKARQLWWMGLMVTLSESKHRLRSDSKFWERTFNHFYQ